MRAVPRHRSSERQGYRDQTGELLIRPTTIRAQVGIFTIYPRWLCHVASVNDRDTFSNKDIPINMPVESIQTLFKARQYKLWNCLPYQTPAISKQMVVTYWKFFYCVLIIILLIFVWSAWWLSTPLQICSYNIFQCVCVYIYIYMIHLSQM